jgi:hypothetical protein
MQKDCRAGLATDDNMAHAHCTVDTQGYKHTPRLCNTYCFSTATKVCANECPCYVVIRTVLVYLLFSLHSVNSCCGAHRTSCAVGVWGKRRFLGGVNVTSHVHLAVGLRMTGAVPQLPHNVMVCSSTALLLPTYATVLSQTLGGSVYWFLR